MRTRKLTQQIPTVAHIISCLRRNCSSSSSNRMYTTTIMSEVFTNDDDDPNSSARASVVDKTRVRDYAEIPGPRQLPLIGNAWRFAPIIGQYKIAELDKVMWSLYRDYGRIVKVGGLVGHPDLLFVFNGDDIKTVFRREEVLPHRPSMPSLHYYKQKLQKDFFKGNAGVIGIHGPEWDSFRKEVQQILLPPTAARKYLGPLDGIAAEFLQRMENMLDGNQELPDNFLSEIYKWALESVVRVSLDTRLGCLDLNQAKNSESQRIIDSINTFFWHVAEVELKMPIWRIYKNKSFRKYIGALEDFRILCMHYITQALHRMEHEGTSSPNNVDDASIVEKILNKTNNPKLAAVLALDLMLVGVDTTSIALASTIYQLSQNPEKQQKLFEELRGVLENIDSKFDVNVQENIPYLRACIKETLRMYPVIIGNGRSLQTEAIISGYRVPKGTHVIFPHLVVSNSSEYFKNPASFEPERWLNSGSRIVAECPAAHDRIHPFVSLPFGYGRRSCLGRRFAEAELQILISKIFRKYKVEYNYEPLTYKITPTYVPEQPLKFKLTLRR